MHKKSVFIRYKVFHNFTLSQEEKGGLNQIKSGETKNFLLWEQEAAGSSPATPT